MKTCKNLLSGLVSALLLIVGLTGCQDYEIPAANTSLSYPAGEMALGGGIYTSAQPTIRSASTPQFSITGITHNGNAADASIASITPATGVISITPENNLTAIGIYLVSVRMHNDDGEHNYPDAFKLVVKGIVFEQSEVAATRGEEVTFPMKEAYLAQTEGTAYYLAAPEDNTDYGHFTVDPKTCAITVDALAEAGIYPISIQVKNNTNPDGTIFTDVMTITVESKPYDMKYTPDVISLIPLEGHISPKPTLRAATLSEGMTVTYSLLDTYQGAFSIDATTGEISLAEDTPLIAQTAKTFKLQVRASNAKGTSSFPDIYAVTIDPNKKAAPITALSYPGKFPVALKPGQAWTSERPSITGSTVGIAYSLPNAPDGVTINTKTGVVTLAEGHHMPLLTENNKLTVNVRNQGMDTPFGIDLGDFSIDPVYWKVAFVKNSTADSRVNSGIGNMDRYSFSGYIQHNNTEANINKPTTIQVKNGIGKSNGKSVNGFDCIDAIGAGTGTWSDNTFQNNDWVVSSEIEIPAYGFHPSIAFNFASQFGKDPNNILEVYIVEINASNPYSYNPATDQNQDSKGLAAKPCNLPWTALATSDANNADIAGKIAPNHSSAPSNELNTFPLAARSFDISAYQGKKVRIALRYWNPSTQAADDAKNSGRTYRIESLRIEDRLAN